MECSRREGHIGTLTLLESFQIFRRANRCTQRTKKQLKDPRQLMQGLPLLSLNPTQTPGEDQWRSFLIKCEKTRNPTSSSPVSETSNKSEAASSAREAQVGGLELKNEPWSEEVWERSEVLAKPARAGKVYDRQEDLQVKLEVEAELKRSDPLTEGTVYAEQDQARGNLNKSKGKEGLKESPAANLQNKAKLNPDNIDQINKRYFEEPSKDSSI